MNSKLENESNRPQVQTRSLFFGHRFVGGQQMGLDDCLDSIHSTAARNASGNGRECVRPVNVRGVQIDIHRIIVVAIVGQYEYVGHAND